MIQNKKKEYLSGMRAGIPVVFGFIPVGIAYAIMARQAGLGFFETVFMSVTVFAGASQMMASEMIGQNATAIAIILATFILNLRHLIMSTCVMTPLKKENLPLRLLAAFGVTDESFAIFTTRSGGTMFFFLGLITVTYSSWVAGGAIGALASDFLPAILTNSFGVALYAMFISLIVPGVKGNWKLFLLVVMCAGVNSVLNIWIESSWALIISTVVCAAAGAFFVDLPEDKKEGAK